MFIVAVLIFLSYSLFGVVDAATLDFKNNAVDVEFKSNDDSNNKERALVNQNHSKPITSVTVSHSSLKVGTFDPHYSSIRQVDIKPEESSILSEVSHLEAIDTQTQPDYFKQSSEHNAPVDLLNTGVVLASNYAVENEVEDIYNRTANALKRFNDLWNDLDDEINFKLYRGLEYVNLSESSLDQSREDDLLARLAEAELREKLKASNSNSQKSDAQTKFFGLVLNFHKLFTLSNVFILTAVLLVGNGLFRAFRYILLRLL